MKSVRFKALGPVLSLAIYYLAINSFNSLAISLAVLAHSIPSAYAAPGNSHETSLSLNEQGVKAMQRNDLTAAEGAFRQALVLDPGSLSAAFNLAGVYITLKKHDLAIQLLTDYTKRDGTDAGLYARLGDAYFSSKQPEKAQAAYEHALKIAPNYHDVPARLASIYGLQKKFPEAEKMFEKALAQNPKDMSALNSLGNLYILSGKSDRAIQLIKQGLQVKPLKELYVTLGTAYEANRDLKNSLVAFEKAIDLGETRPEVKAKVAQLQKQVS